MAANSSEVGAAGPVEPSIFPPAGCVPPAPAPRVGFFAHPAVKTRVKKSTQINIPSTRTRDVFIIIDPSPF
jgi:hypothetical protein